MDDGKIRRTPDLARADAFSEVCLGPRRTVTQSLLPRIAAAQNLLIADCLGSTISLAAEILSIYHCSLHMLPSIVTCTRT